MERFMWFFIKLVLLFLVIHLMVWGVRRLWEGKTITLLNGVEALAVVENDYCSLDFVKCGEEEEEKNIDLKIFEAFPEDPLTALAIFKAESGLDPTAKGYNCRYNGISQACKKGDEGKAWSVDCGIAQINVIGSECPADLFNEEENLKVAKKMYETRGFSPWVAYNKGLHKKHLTK